MKTSTAVPGALLLLCCLGVCADAYLIGAWNIRIFGQSKMEDPDVVDVLVDTLKRYDVVLVQEIRDASGTAIEELLALLQDEDSSYEMVLGPRLGRSDSKEQYAYIYRTSGVSLINSYTYSDTGDNFERQPLIGHFETSEGFTFALIGCHVKPSEAVEEIDALPLVYNDVKRKLGEDNTMLLGDFNADCSFVNNGEYSDLTIFNSNTYTSLLDIDTTLAASSCAYDRIVVTGDIPEVIVQGTADIFAYDSVFRLSQSEAEDVSDHYPVEVRIEPEGFLTKQTFYKNDFRSSVDSHWNSNRHGTTPNGKKFLGNFAVDGAPIELTIESREIPKADVRGDFLLEFQLYVIGVWNGKGNNGPDVFEVEIEGVTRFKASFCNAQSDSDFQSYPSTRLSTENPCKSGAYRKNNLGYGNDAVYKLSVPFLYRYGPLNVVFRAFTEGSEESRSSESWGLDSVELSFIGSAPHSKQAEPYAGALSLPSAVVEPYAEALPHVATVPEVGAGASAVFSFDDADYSSAASATAPALALALVAILFAAL